MMSELDPIQAFPPCASCGTPLDPEANFCSECWRAFSAGEWNSSRADQANATIAAGDAGDQEQCYICKSTPNHTTAARLVCSAAHAWELGLAAAAPTIIGHHATCAFVGGEGPCDCEYRSDVAHAYRNGAEAERARFEAIIDTHIKIHEHCNKRKSNLRKGAITALQIIRRAVREDTPLTSGAGEDELRDSAQGDGEPPATEQGA
jgi:hypothetical protein